ncbi:hypothetical protein HS088_TW02G00322 [Tripterygium wilfordii]|uniref:Uncharacterized protein n=1 Tax=Tripterygium wilfordii TaxID=458696 RepID=A0A7J7DYG3_TRIWF|nr:hypothetical protein HS088_TW02G00322 [Tripterygium wilfordii]
MLFFLWLLSLLLLEILVGHILTRPFLRALPSSIAYGSIGAPTMIEHFERLHTELCVVAEEQASLRAYLMSGFEDLRTEQMTTRDKVEALMAFLGCPPPDDPPPS